MRQLKSEGVKKTYIRGWLDVRKNGKLLNGTQIIVIGILACFLLAFMIPYIAHGVLTLLHGGEFMQSFDYRMEGEAELFRVITYTSDLARVYYVGGTAGFVREFSQNDGVWEVVSTGTIWAYFGNADGFIWPYLFHSDEGIALFIFLIIPALLVLLLIPTLVSFIVRVTKRTRPAK